LKSIFLDFKSRRECQTLGSRPGDRRKAVHDALVRPEVDLGDAVVAAAQEQRGRMLRELRKQLSVLNNVQLAILKRMARLGDRRWICVSCDNGRNSPPE
jgi:hypothetical protein